MAFSKVSKRCLTFLYNSLQELTIMEVECIQGSKEIWVCLCALEVLNNTKVSKVYFDIKYISVLLTVSVIKVPNQFKCF